MALADASGTVPLSTAISISDKIVEILRNLIAIVVVSVKNNYLAATALTVLTAPVAMRQLTR